MRKARGFKEVLRDASKRKYKHTSIGNSRNTRIRKELKRFILMVSQCIEGKENE